MRRKHRSALVGVVTLAIAAGLVLGAVSPALAAAPPWEPDPNATAPYGRIVFYDSTGNVLTGGNDLSHLADFAATTTAKDTGATLANLIFAAPDHTKVTGLWATDAASASTAFPNNSAPAPITGPGFANPLVTLTATDADLASFLGGITKDTTAGYANIYEVRLKDSGPGGAGSGTHYWETDVMVDETAGTWTVVDPAITTTSTSITTTPPTGGSVVQGNNVGLSATVTPASNGSVQFFRGATAVGSPHAVTTGGATVNDTDVAPPNGTHQYKAIFTPTGGTTVQGSTSPNSAVTVGPPATATNTALTASPSTAAQYAPVTLTANVTPLAAVPGTVEFFDGASSLGSDTTDSPTAGEYSIVVSTLTQGAHNQIHATFTSNSSSYAPSTSANITVTITAPACPGSPVPGASCTDDQTITVAVNAGSLTISTPYTPTNPFVLPAMQLNTAGTQLSSSARFPAAADNQIVVTSSLAGSPNWTVSVSATDLTSGTNTINGAGLGLTGGTLNATPVFPGTVTFTDNPAHDWTGPPLPGGNHGIKGGPWTFAQSSGGGSGTASMFGTLTLLAPTSTAPGTYTGTITFTVA